MYNIQYIETGGCIKFACNKNRKITINGGKGSMAALRYIGPIN